MLKTIAGIYDQGEIKLHETPDDIPPKTKVIVTFLNESQSDYVQEKISNKDDLLEAFLLEAKEISQTHQLPEGYRFNRQELYENEN